MANSIIKNSSIYNVVVLFSIVSLVDESRLNIDVSINI